MKARTGQRPIRTRILTTLVLLTGVILLSVALAFNLFIRGYVHSRVTDQLASIQRGIEADRRGGKGMEPPGRSTGRGRKFDGGQDRVTGVRGGAVALDESGAVRDTLNGDQEVVTELCGWFSDGNHTLSEAVRRKKASLENGDFILSVVRDREEAGVWWVCYVDVTAIQAFTRQVNLMLSGIVLAAIGLSFFLSRRVADSFSAPVQSLSDFAGEIGRGTFRRRAFRFRDAEFSRLGESMNRMAEQLQEANRKQETFFQNVSHELRTPLTSIRGNAEGIVYGIMDPKASGQIILSEADRLGGFVEDLLYLSRMGRAVPEDAPEPLDLRDVLSLCVSEQRAEADGRGVAFAFDFDENPVLYPVRERDARQIFGNLISNAVRYAAGTVRLSCHAAASGVTVTVADDGPGIAPEDLPHVFERFYKGAGGKHGIGLSIAKAAAEACHGSIAAENDGGARFTVRFPA